MPPASSRSSPKRNTRAKKPAAALASPLAQSLPRGVASVANLPELLYSDPTIIDVSTFNHVDDLAEKLRTSIFTDDGTALLCVPHTLHLNQFLVLANIVHDNIISACKIVIFDDFLERVLLRDTLGVLMMWDFTQEAEFILH